MIFIDTGCDKEYSAVDCLAGQPVIDDTRVRVMNIAALLKGASPSIPMPTSAARCYCLAEL